MKATGTGVTIGTVALHDSGPFHMRRLPYRLRFRMQEKCVAVESAHGPAGYTTWRFTHHRLRWWRIPLTPWREGSARFYPPKWRER